MYIWVKLNFDFGFVGINSGYTTLDYNSEVTTLDLTKIVKELTRIYMKNPIDFEENSEEFLITRGYARLSQFDKCDGDKIAMCYETLFSV